MTRDNAFQILTKYLKDERLIKHCLSTEVAMRSLARYFGEDAEMWGITGLLHDADYELSKGRPEKHGLLLFNLEPNIPEGIKYAIESHNYAYTDILPKSKMDWSITCSDQLTGLIVACALVTPEKKLAGLTNDFVLKKLRQKDFAKGADRTRIYLCEEKLGIPLLEFITIVLNSLKEIHEALEL